MSDKTKNAGDLLKNKEISKELHDQAVELTRKNHPWYWKKNNNNKITGINDIFGGMNPKKKSK